MPDTGTREMSSTSRHHLLPIVDGAKKVKDVDDSIPEPHVLIRPTLLRNIVVPIRVVSFDRIFPMQKLQVAQSRRPSDN
jgi:hypothetical protein